MSGNQTANTTSVQSSTAPPDKRAGESQKEYEQRIALERRLNVVRNRIVVLSGKGGVGKSTVAVNLAVALAGANHEVGLLDVDVHGPSVPRLLNLEGSQLHSADNSIIPVWSGNLRVMSIGFMLQTRDEAVIWRGPRKMGMIRAFLSDVEWGMLDYLVVDCPPGTGDEPLSVVQLLGDVTGAVIVTTPQTLATLDVRKSITFCETLKVPVLGVIENMSGLTCPRCGEVVDVFGSGGGEAMATDMGVPFLGRIPLDPQIATAGDAGKPFSVGGSASSGIDAFGRVVDRLRERIAEVTGSTADIDE